MRKPLRCWLGDCWNVASSLEFISSTDPTSVPVTPAASFSQPIFLLSFLIFALEFVHKSLSGSHRSSEGFVLPSLVYARFHHDLVSLMRSHGHVTWLKHRMSSALLWQKQRVRKKLKSQKKEKKESEENLKRWFPGCISCCECPRKLKLTQNCSYVDNVIISSTEKGVWVNVWLRDLSSFFFVCVRAVTGGYGVQTTGLIIQMIYLKPSIFFFFFLKLSSE